MNLEEDQLDTDIGLIEPVDLSKYSQISQSLPLDSTEPPIPFHVEHSEGSSLQHQNRFIFKREGDEGNHPRFTLGHANSSSREVKFSLMNPNPKYKPMIKLIILGLILGSMLLISFVYQQVIEDEFYKFVNRCLATILTFMALYSYNRLYSVKLPNFRRVSFQKLIPNREKFCL